jgi:hypothetical protein
LYSTKIKNYLLLPPPPDDLPLSLELDELDLDEEFTSFRELGV